MTRGEVFFFFLGGGDVVSWFWVLKGAREDEKYDLILLYNSVINFAKTQTCCESKYLKSLSNLVQRIIDILRFGLSRFRFLVHAEQSRVGFEIVLKFFNLAGSVLAEHVTNHVAEQVPPVTVSGEHILLLETRILSYDIRDLAEFYKRIDKSVNIHVTGAPPMTNAA